jgi:hypothetical protein
MASSIESDSATQMSLPNVASATAIDTSPKPSVTASLIDPTEVETEVDSHTEARVEVTTPVRTDTIPGIVAETPPGVTPDGVVYGITVTHDGDLGKAFSYDSKTRELSFMPLPGDVRKWDSKFTISPDGRHVAYLGGDSAGSAGFVRTWPAMTLVARTPSAPAWASDYNLDQVRWTSANQFELFFRFPAGVDSTNHMIARFIVARGDVRTRRIVVDTSATIPQWDPDS